MGSRNHVISVALMGEHKDLQRAFREGEKSADGFVKKMGGAAMNVAGFFFDVAKKVGFAIGAIGAAIAGIAIKGGIARALDTEDAITKMRRLGLTTEEIEEAVGAVDKAFDGTVFSNPEGFALFAKLQGLGVELSEIPTYIEEISDMAAFANAPLGQMDDIFSKIIGNGKVSGEELNRLADAGIPLTALAEALGMSVAELREMTSEGEFTSDMFLEAVESVEQFNGAAKAAGDTTRGAASNVLSQLKKLGELFVGPLFGENGPMVTLFKSMRTALIDLRPDVKYAGEVMGNFLVPKMEALAEWLEGGGLPKLIENVKTKFFTWAEKLRELWPLVKDGVDYVKDLFDRLKDGENPLKGVTTGFMMLGGPLMLIVRELFPAIKPLLEAILPPLVEMANSAAPALAEVFTELVHTILPPLVDFLGWLAEVLKANPELVMAVVAAIATFKTIMFVIQIINGIKLAFVALKLAMLSNPFALLAAAVVALAVLVYKNWDEIVAFLKKVWDWIKDAAGAVGEWISEKFKMAVDFVKDLFLNFTPLGLIIKNFDRIKELATGVWMWLKEKFSQAVEFIKNLFFNFTPLGFIISRFDRIKELAAETGQWIKDKFNSVVDFFKGLPGRIGNAVTGLWDGLKTAFRSAVNWIIDKWNAWSFSAGFNLPELFGGGRVQVSFDTPNIPRIHSGGLFTPQWGDEGLALLRRGERVLTPDQQRGGAAPSAPMMMTPLNITVQSTDPDTLVETLQEWARVNSGLPISIRAT